MYKIITFCFVFSVGVLGIYSFHFSAFTQLKPVPIEEYPIQNVLENLGGERLNHTIDQADSAKAIQGRDLLYLGYATNDGKQGKRISPYFTCIDCHNMKRESELATDSDLAKKLIYVTDRNLPFLPGSTLWGVYNRTSFYNGDYVKKYGNIIQEAKSSLPAAVQVCAEFCSSGRALEEWELEAIMHYFKQHELKVGDLNFSGDEIRKMVYYTDLKAAERISLREKIKASYVQAYPATFVETMPLENRNYGKSGDPALGALIYSKSCLHCHEKGRVTKMVLKDDKVSAKMLVKNMKSFDDLSIYQIIRQGTYSSSTRKQYMPLYPKEKMSDEQIEHLAAYLTKLAKKR